MDTNKYTKIQELGEELKCFSSDIAYICKTENIHGAVQFGYIWLIPRSEIDNIKSSLNRMRMSKDYRPIVEPISLLQFIRKIRKKGKRKATPTRRS